MSARAAAFLVEIGTEELPPKSLPWTRQPKKQPPKSLPWKR